MDGNLKDNVDIHSRRFTGFVTCCLNVISGTTLKRVEKSEAGVKVTSVCLPKAPTLFSAVETGSSIWSALTFLSLPVFC